MSATSAREHPGGDPATRLREHVRSLRERNRQLEHALESRIVIEQAKGILAERHGIDPDAAFERLRGAARRHRIGIHGLAREVVASRRTPESIVEQGGLRSV